jgi:hypothetical protein
MADHRCFACCRLVPSGVSIASLRPVETTGYCSWAAATFDLPRYFAWEERYWAVYCSGPGLYDKEILILELNQWGEVYVPGVWYTYERKCC